MKYFIIQFSILTFLISIPTFGQGAWDVNYELTKTDNGILMREKNHVKALVVNCQVYNEGTSIRNKKYSAICDKKGNIIQDWMYESNTAHYSSVTKYFYNNNTLMEEWEYGNDSTNAPLKIKYYYDSFGNYLTTSYDSLSTYKTDTSYTLFFPTKNKRCLSFFYNKEGKIVQKIQYTDSTKKYWYSRDTLIYDLANRVIMHKSFSGLNGKLAILSDSCVYDKNGNLTDRNFYKSGDNFYYKLSYDKKGQLSTMSIRNRNTNFSLDRTFVNQYEYDKKGNLVLEKRYDGANLLLEKKIKYKYYKNNHARRKTRIQH